MLQLSPSDQRKKLLRQEYLTRMNKVVDYIYDHLAEPITLNQLARVAIFSPFHFHRLFSAFIGETPSAFIKRLRLEKAASALRLKTADSITNIALDCGFSSSALFSRVFREHFCMSASQYRVSGYLELSPREKRKNQKKSQDSKKRQNHRKLGQHQTNLSQEKETVSPYINEQSLVMERNKTMKVHVQVKEIPAMHVAYFRHVGPYHKIEEAFQRLKAWAEPRGLYEQDNIKVLAVYHDDPEVTDESKLHSSACITIPSDSKVSGEEGMMDIPGGQYAVARVEINTDQFDEAWNALLRDWLPESGFQPDDRPCYELYINDAKYHPEGKHIVDICEPVKPL